MGMTKVLDGPMDWAGGSRPIALLARIGLLAYGVMHLLVGWIALQLAWGMPANKSADSAGALSTLAEQPFGTALLWAAAAGLGALCLWQLGEAGWGYRNRSGARRVLQRLTSVLKALIYLALGVSAGSLALGTGSATGGGGAQEVSGVFAWPFGQFIVAAVGLVVVGLGLAKLAKGVKASFMDDIDTSEMSARARETMTHLGRAGHIAKGVALTVVGGLLGYAALTFDARKASGLDGALHLVLVQPFGKFLLSAIALGFMAFGLFSILQSRYRRM